MTSSDAILMVSLSNWESLNSSSDMKLSTD
jgi:hypothetical protein